MGGSVRLVMAVGPSHDTNRKLIYGYRYTDQIVKSSLTLETKTMCQNITGNQDVNYVRRINISGWNRGLGCTDQFNTSLLLQPLQATENWLKVNTIITSPQSRTPSQIEHTIAGNFKRSLPIT